jgi:hypothetical protein
MKKYIQHDCRDFARKFIEHLEPKTLWYEMTAQAIKNGTEQKLIQELKLLNKQTPQQVSRIMGAKLYAEFNEIRRLKSSSINRFWGDRFNWGLYANLQDLKK